MMRLIVACPKCRRRYDAKGRRPGSKFRCLCGEPLVVKSPRGHDASVVRCSSCGAPREEEAEACGHCHSDFTLHERDLHSVCPGCLARVSDKARYCHHCAAPLFADTVAGDTSPLCCPACTAHRKLVSRRFGDFPVAVLECQSCAGLWLGLEAMEELLSAESRGAKPAVGHIKPTLEKSSAQNAARKSGYRKCLVCEELMSRKNLAWGKSGVVVDLCGRHGIWFDSDELAELIAWTRAGGLEDLRRDLARLVGSKDLTRKRTALDETLSKRVASNKNPPLERTLRISNDLDWIFSIVELAAHLILR